MELLEYCENKRIVIYGAGLFGRIVRCFLMQSDVDIYCFAVTGTPERETLLEKRVNDIYSISDINNLDVGVLICANSNLSHEMQKKIKEVGREDYYVVDETQINEIDDATEYLNHYHDSRKHVLLYHRIAEISTDVWNMTTTPDVFRRHLSYLKSQYEIVRFEDITFDDDREQMAITIDDGYIDSYTNILPICNELMVPVTIFVSTGNVGTDKEFWWDIIERVFFDNSSCPDLIEWAGENILLRTAEERIDACWKIWNDIVLVDKKQREKMLDELIVITHDSGRNRKLNRTVNENELIELDRSQWITIGAHTVTHTRLTSESKEKMWIEISQSKNELERIIGHEVSTMSFPFGCESDYDMVAIDAAKQAGYKKVAAVRPKYLERGMSNWNTPRISIHERRTSEDKIRELRRSISLYE